MNYTSSLLEYDVTLELNKQCPSVREEAAKHKGFHGTKTRDNGSVSDARDGNADC